MELSLMIKHEDCYWFFNMLDGAANPEEKESCRILDTEADTDYSTYIYGQSLNVPVKKVLHSTALAYITAGTNPEQEKIWNGFKDPSPPGFLHGDCTRDHTGKKYRSFKVNF